MQVKVYPKRLGNLFCAFLSPKYSGIPSANTDINSPKPTVSTLNQYEVVIEEIVKNTTGIKNALKITGISAPINGFLTSLVPMQASAVASVPISISQIPIGIFAKKQPIISPGIASGNNSGKSVSASEKRIWIAPYESGYTARVIVA